MSDEINARFEQKKIVAKFQHQYLGNLPPGGTTGQVATKHSDENYDVQWVDPNTTSERVLTIASSATPTINVDQYDLLDITALDVPITGFIFEGTPHDDQRLKIRVKDDGTPRAIAHGSSVVNSGIAKAITTTVANKTHLEGLIYNLALAKWVCYAADAAGL